MSKSLLIRKSLPTAGASSTPDSLRTSRQTAASPISGSSISMVRRTVLLPPALTAIPPPAGRPTARVWPSSPTATENLSSMSVGWTPVRRPSSPTSNPPCRHFLVAGWQADCLHVTGLHRSAENRLASRRARRSQVGRRAEVV